MTKETKQERETEEMVLQLSDLRSWFFTAKGTAPAVDGVSIDVPRGKIVGLVGESGCGKSMTAMSIMGLVKRPGKVVGGTITLEGRDITHLSKRELSKMRGNEISMIFQEPMTSLNPVYPVGRQVQEAILLHQKVSKEEAKNQVIEIFRQVGIPEPEKRYRSYPHQLSGGLRQRVMIGMAMVCRPKVLIADEPTTALDVTIQAQILELMQDLQKKLGMAIIMVTHDLGVIAELCDEIIVLYGGRVCERGTAEDIFYRPRHEYTKGLLRSIPNVDRIGEKLIPIPGTPINLLNMPRGCAFCPRCENAMKICIEQVPPEMQMPDGHYAACWLNVKEEMLAKQGGANK